MQSSAVVDAIDSSVQDGTRSAPVTLISPALLSAGEARQDSNEEKRVEVIPIEGEYFISIQNYAWVTDEERTTLDWIRHQDGIYLNGFSLRTITDILKKEYLKELLASFLYEVKEPAIIKKRIAALHELATQFFGNTAGLHYLNPAEERDVPDSFADKLATHLRKIIFNFDFFDKKDPDKKPLYHFSDTEEIKLLRGLVKKFSLYFSGDGIKNSRETFKKILSDYLLYTFSNDEHKQKYIDYFFKVAHHGGFMYALFAAHLQHIDKTKYAIQSNACLDQSRIDVTSDEYGITIEESTPILRIVSVDGSIPDVENEDGSNVMETRVKHRITMDVDGNVTLKIISAADYSYNNAARDILIGDWLKLNKMLSNYATNYIYKDHNLPMISAIFAAFPWIKNLDTLRKPSLFHHVFSRFDMPYQGDKIFLCLGRCSPSFAENILAQMNYYAEMGEIYFMRAVKLLQRMNRNDLANKALHLYLEKAEEAHGSAKQNDRFSHDKDIKAAYQQMISIGFLSRSAAKAKATANENLASVVDAAAAANKPDSTNDYQLKTPWLLQ